MVIFEFLAVLLIAIVLITTVISIGRPISEMLAQRTIFKYKQLDSEAAVKLKERIVALEEDLRQVHRQMEELKASTEFTVKLLERSGFNATQAIELKDKSDNKPQA